MSIAGIRLQRSDLPREPTACPKVCVYRSDRGFCDGPRDNKGNSDAACHKMSNKALLALLMPMFGKVLDANDRSVTGNR